MSRAAVALEQSSASVVLVALAAATATLLAAAVLAPRLLVTDRTPSRRPRSTPTRGRLDVRVPFHGRPRPPSDDDVADWCDDLARRVRSGESLTMAVLDEPLGGEVAVRIETIVGPMRQALRRGVPLVDAVAAPPASSTAVTMAVAVLRACARSGGSAAPTLARTASALRDRSAALTERRAQSAQARLSATVLTVLPGVVLALIVATSASSRSALAGPVGLLTVPLGLTLNALGWWWMRTLLRSEP